MLSRMFSISRLAKPYAQTYLNCINNRLTAIFNYAVKCYGLKENPCHKAVSMGKKKADEMLFWTKDEFQTVIEGMKYRPANYTVSRDPYVRCNGRCGGYRPPIYPIPAWLTFWHCCRKVDSRL